MAIDFETRHQNKGKTVAADWRYIVNSSTKQIGKTFRETCGGILGICMDSFFPGRFLKILKGLRAHLEHSRTSTKEFFC